MKVKTQHSGKIERHRPGSKKDPLTAAAATWRACYAAACKHDGMPEDAKFAVFSTDNPYVQFVNAAAQEYFTRMKEYHSGGYVGLTLA